MTTKNKATELKSGTTAPRSYQVHQERSKWNSPNAVNDRMAMAKELKKAVK